MRNGMAARVSSLFVVLFVLTVPVFAKPSTERPVKDLPPLQKIFRKFRQLVGANETTLSVPKP